jgi:REP element-mobilizing transposase RayT
LYDSERFRNQWVATLGELRQELGFKIVGYVLMPEHFHVLVWPTPEANPSQIMPKLADRTAVLILKNLRENLGFPWCRRMLVRVTLPPTVHHHAHFRVGQRKSYDMNIWTARKVEGELPAQQSSEARVGEGARRLAVVQLEVSFSA